MITLKDYKKYTDCLGFEENELYNKNSTNIECPNCKNELVYSNDIVYYSCPAQRDVHCESCKFQTRIYI